jgi:hydrogenase-4 membrane subunit HyfE
MNLQILIHQINLRLFLMVAAGSLILAIFVQTATSLIIHTLGSPATLIRPFGYFFSGILMWVLLLMVIDYFIGYTRACSIDITAN